MHLQTLMGHKHFVSALQFTSDQKYLISGSFDCNLKFWDFENSNCISTLEGHTGTITSVQVSKDNLLILSSSNDHTIRLWDRFNFTCQLTVIAHNDRVSAATFSATMKSILSVSVDKTMKVWDLDTLMMNVTQDIINNYEVNLTQPSFSLFSNQQFSIFKLSILHIICYMKNIHYLNLYLDELMEKNIYVHLTEDYFKKSVLDIVAENGDFNMFQLLIKYYAIVQKPKIFCKCCQQQFTKIFNEYFNENYLYMGKLLDNCVKNSFVYPTVPQLSGKFDGKILITSDEQYLTQDDIRKNLPLIQKGGLVQKYQVKVLELENIYKIQDDSFLHNICKLTPSHSIFQSETLSYVLQYKSDYYAQIFFYSSATFHFFYALIYLYNSCFLTLMRSIQKEYDIYDRYSMDLNIAFLIIEFIQLCFLSFKFVLMNQVFGKRGWNYLRLVSSVMVTSSAIFDIVQINYQLSEDFKNYVKVLQNYTFLVLGLEITQYFHLNRNMSLVVRTFYKIINQIKYYMIFYIYLIWLFASASLISSFSIDIWGLLQQHYELIFQNTTFYTTYKQSTQLPVHFYIMYLLTTLVLAYFMFLLLIAVVNNSFQESKINDIIDYNYEKCLTIYEIELFIPDFIRRFIDYQINAQKYLLICEKVQDEPTQNKNIHDEFREKVDKFQESIHQIEEQNNIRSQQLEDKLNQVLLQLNNKNQSFF